MQLVWIGLMEHLPKYLGSDERDQIKIAKCL